jgi:hypothetical protein
MAMPAAFLTPRPLPSRRVGVTAGGLAVLLALLVFLIGGWSLRGWALGALLWVASQAFGFLLGKAGIGQPTLGGSGVVAFGMMTRGIAAMVIAIAIASVDEGLGLATGLVYAAAFTVELAFSLVVYFQGEPRVAVRPEDDER